MFNRQPEIAAARGTQSAGLFPTHRISLSHEDREGINQLIGAALLDATLEQRLLHKQDDSLFATCSISAEAQRWLSTVRATSLAEFAQQVVGSW